MTSSFVVPPPRSMPDDFKLWLHKSSAFVRHLPFNIDNTKTAGELEDILRRQAHDLIIGSPFAGAIHGHLYHILYPLREEALRDAEFGKHYVERDDADPRMLISACAIQYLVLTEKIGFFNEQVTGCSTIDWTTEITGIVCEGNNPLLSMFLEMSFNESFGKKPPLDSLNDYLFPEGIPGGLTEEELDLFLVAQMKEKINALSFPDQLVCYEHLTSFLGHPVDHAWINNFHPKQLNALVVGFMMTRIKALETFLNRAEDKGFNIRKVDEMQMYLNWALQHHGAEFKLLSEEGRVEFDLFEKIKKSFINETNRDAIGFLRLRRSLTTIRPMVFKTITNTDGSVNGDTIDVATQGLSDSERDARMTAIVLGNDTDSSNWAHEIIPGLWVGAEASATEVGTKFQRNIHVTGRASRAPDPSLVTTYSVGDPTDRTPGPHMEYVRILSGPAYKESDPSTWFQKVFAEMDFALSKGETLLVNCTVGESRSVTLVCAYLMNRLKAPLAAVLPFIQSKRITAEPVPKLFAVLEAYETYCLDSSRT